MNINDMTLEMKIGQMIMAGFPSKYYDTHLKEIIEEYKIGNIILFASNIGCKDEIAKLTGDIQESMLKNIGVPAFISIDQEGGMVTRIYDGGTIFPGNMAFAAADIENGTLIQGRIVGEELRAFGINLNLAPVVDVNINPKNPVIGVRSYGDDPKKVGMLGVGLIKGLQESGVVATAKHFPGHGDTELDSHLDLPMVPHNMERLMNVELYPFKRAIENGVDAIMSAHVLFPAIEEKRLPATLSYNVLTKLLREKMIFKGLIITDCMEMNAISSYYGSENAAVMAINAGADIICISHRPELQIKSVNVIKEAVLKGVIKESRIDESVERILSVKAKYGLFKNSYPDLERVNNFVGCSENKAFSKKVSERSITLVKDEYNLLPVEGSVVSISTSTFAINGADDEIKKKGILCEAIKERIGGEAFTIPSDPEMGLINGIVEKCRNADRIIIGTYNLEHNYGQVMLINEIKKVNKNIIVVSLRSPYDFSVLSDISTFICAYEYTQLSICSVVKVLTGEAEPLGRLPIVIK